ncbi:MAG: PAS domain S-box protein, partial [Thermodesulfobacteriota bacterium]
MNTVAGFDMAESLDNNYKKIFDEAPDMIFVFDLETGMIVNCNKAASGVLGWQKDELIGRHQTFLQPSQEDIDFSPRRHNKGTGPGIDDYLEARVVKKDGTVFDAAIKTRFLELEGKKVVLGIFRNITKKKEYERELERISGFPDQDPNPVFRVNRDGAVMYANQAGRELLEYWQTGEGQSLPPLFRDPLLELGNGSATKYLEISIKEKTYQFAIQAVSGEDYFNIYSMDISERVNSELALRRNVEMYSLTQKAANIGSWDWDVRNDHMYWSDNIESMLGLEKGTFKGDFAAFLELVHPDDRDYFETAVNNILKKAGDYNLEHRIILPDGSIRWLRENGMTIVDQSGQAIRMLGIVQDITRRREIMEQIAILSRAVEQSPVSVMITDLDGRIVYVNPKFSQISGYTREEVIGKNPRMLKSGQQRPGFYKELWETISAGKEWQGEFCNLDKFGRKFWERASISLLTDYWGNPLYYIAVKEDITERKKQERKIEFFALHDALTGLYNRISFMDHFKKSLNI